MDLISREALLYDLCEDREEGTFEFTKKQSEAADKTVRYIYDRIVAQPVISAVPLDKLCEWLANNTYLKTDDEAAWELDADNWKKVLTKWMEEQDAAD